VARVAEHLTRNGKTLSSNPGRAKKERRKERVGLGCSSVIKCSSRKYMQDPGLEPRTAKKKKKRKQVNHKTDRSKHTTMWKKNTCNTSNIKGLMSKVKTNEYVILKGEN
jgi:hypothetical protein